jgi:hypothetical protein
MLELAEQGLMQVIPHALIWALPKSIPSFERQETAFGWSDTTSIPTRGSRNK